VGGEFLNFAESALIRHQLLILNRGRKRAPNLRVSDRIIAGLCTRLMRPARLLRSSIVLRPSTLLHFHRTLTKRKYRMLFSAKRGRQPGPRGPAKELIDAVVEMKLSLLDGCALSGLHSQPLMLLSRNIISNRRQG
jgi:putative transposase